MVGMGGNVGLMNFYRGDCEEHDDELVLREDWVPRAGVYEAHEAATSLLDEERIGGYMIAVD